MKRVVIALIVVLALAGCSVPFESIPPIIIMVDPVAEPVEPIPIEPEPPVEPILSNRAPMVTVDDISATVGAPITLSVWCYDPDDDPLTVEWSGAFVGTGETFEWTPDTEGEFEVTVSVSDGEFTVTDSAVILVSPPPWVPEILHVYIFDFTDTIAYDTECTEATYGSTFSSYRTAVELWNRDGKEGSPFYVVGGGMP